MPSNKHPLQPRKRPRQQRSARTRDQILEAAVEVFTQHGYARGTTNRIAERADISVGSLYQYYPNKDAILIELAGRHLDAGVAATADHLEAGAITSVQDAIRNIVAAAIHNHRHDPEFLRVIIDQAPRTHELMAKVAEQQQESVQAMKKLLDGRPEVVVEDKDAAARLVVLTIESVVHQAMSAPKDFDADTLQTELVSMLTRYLTREP
ncbi:TetR/AcrR family transcriptional regulator [Mycolicibacterium neoaurum]|uniref:TetR/AcrR family transcriptional regulator n=1 Tax=Mycolicibacterium neoaurum TaxID=1795 RepID=UPI00248B90E4|nr:TetR/AcrR family transcriptional regulator [Mycolicibacterium neoaurum]WBP92562.1 TetR/AcrR family transcriptional regulator [Mycolicibacterium neoaurum]WBS06543.1 TetR/AcrR family transcriptional regulator [Mycolicibacterium neoaurum]